MTVTWSGHQLKLIGPRRIVVQGKPSLEIEIPRLKRINITGEVIAKPEDGRYDIEPDNHKRQSYNRWALPGSLDDSTLRLYYHQADGSETVLEAGSDYEIVDQAFTGIKPLNHKIFDHYTCYMDYQIRHQRVDVIAINAEREIRLFCGHESLVVPHWPVLPSGWDGIARIYSKFSDSLTENALFPIPDRRFSGLINFELISDMAAKMPEDKIISQGVDNPGNAKVYTRCLDYNVTVGYSAAQADELHRRIAGQKEFTLLYFGDSVTEGGDVDKDKRFTFLLGEWLKKEYPGTKFNIINSAIGGTNSFFGRERFARDVLKYKPDAVTIMFILNDFWGSEDAPVLETHRYFLEELDKINAIPIFMTPNMNMASWMNGLDHAVERIVQLAKQENRMCVDVYALWKRLREYGVPYETLLSNGINHPDNVSAEMFFNSLKILFKA